MWRCVEQVSGDMARSTGGSGGLGAKRRVGRWAGAKPVLRQEVQQETSWKTQGRGPNCKMAALMGNAQRAVV